MRMNLQLCKNVPWYARERVESSHISLTPCYYRNGSICQATFWQMARSYTLCRHRAVLREERPYLPGVPHDGYRVTTVVVNGLLLRSNAVILIDLSSVRGQPHQAKIVT